ncbi:FadR/GntR family transcriptional regulator [Actinocatenispora rupis]|uniref:GntR family transcriptional regulator n=1 Tax=Actinocatenispora rupis TaxID=519421 RepID=A0A8J3NE33_9ACTN|nr:FCD domain-containing protein [Actinocatenispora rupis]GID12134.1 GntR family transcriptional regulator [Actinocatenispora rupis]
MTDRDAALQARIVGLIHDRGLGPGAPLPTEPQLVDLLGASRNSVREAVRALRALGIVEIRRGLGMFVGEAPLSVLTPSLSFRIRAGDGGDVGSLRDLVEVRELLEVGLIGQVAGTLSAARLAALDALVRRMGEDPETDRAFHALLYESAGNALVLQLIQLFWDVYHDVEPTLGPPEDRAAEIEANHDRIVAALRAGDAAAAQDAMRRHFTDVKARISRAAR